MRGDQVNAGDVVEYRGQPVEVVYAWRPGYNAPAGGFDEPVGVELKLAEGLVIRAVWPPMGSGLELEESLVAYPIEAR